MERGGQQWHAMEDYSTDEVVITLCLTATHHKRQRQREGRIQIFTNIVYIKHTERHLWTGICEVCYYNWKKSAESIKLSHRMTKTRDDWQLFHQLITHSIICQQCTTQHCHISLWHCHSSARHCHICIWHCHSSVSYIVTAVHGTDASVYDRCDTVRPAYVTVTVTPVYNTVISSACC